MEPKISLLRSQEPARGSYNEAVSFSTFCPRFFVMLLTRSRVTSRVVGGGDYGCVRISLNNKLLFCQTEQNGLEVTVQTCVRDLLDPNFGRDTEYHD